VDKGGHDISGNTFATSANVAFIWFEGTNCDLSHNRYRSDTAVDNDNAIYIETGDYNILYGNLVRNTTVGFEAELKVFQNANSLRVIDNIEGV
jgi:parallel beta-helix repeat protein